MNWILYIALFIIGSIVGFIYTLKHKKRKDKKNKNNDPKI